jgi:hypothetical protein
VTGAKSLCLSCLFVRTVRGRGGQQYLLCRNEAVGEKYPRQPVLTCCGYEPAKTNEGGGKNRGARGV